MDIEASLDDAGPTSSDDILAAYRAKKEGKRPVDDVDVKDSKVSNMKDLFGAPPKVSEPEPLPIPEPTPEPEPAPEPTPEPAPEVPPTPVAPQPPEPVPQPEPAPELTPEPPTPEPAPAHVPPAPAPEVHDTRPRDVLPPAAHVPPEAAAAPMAPATRPPPAPAPDVRPGAPLTAMQPGMGLSERLLSDTTITLKGHLLGRRIGMGVAVAGLLLMLVETRARFITGDPGALFGVLPMIGLAWTLTLLGSAAAAAFFFYPPARTLAIELAASQAKEWEDVQEQARMWNLLQWVGMGLLGGGLLLAAAAYAFLPEAQVVAASALLVGVAVAGGGLMFAAWSKRNTLHRLYVQTLLLSRLEQTGLGANPVPQVVKEKDTRLAPVLKALDELLGHLPESSVQRFLDSDESQLYLQLIDEVNEAKDNG